ncbi:MAG: endo alpha-1,4 polygalactosaminidase [Candidatus Sericytochromatia bacterium]|nr:endo alpha-1,4 polygalactosaminidase [Candidatus Sericytochromatia bacterium]
MDSPPEPVLTPPARRWRLGALATLALAAIGGWAANITGATASHVRTLTQADSWAVYYGDQEPPAALQGPDVLVLEPDHAWRVSALRRPGQTVLAYLSLGEVHTTRSYAPILTATPGAIAGRNPDWPDALTVDPRSPDWRRLVIDEVAARILAKGYDGFFLDTIDAAEALEQKGKHPGAAAAMVELIKALKQRYPQALLVANGGHSLLSRLAPSLAGLATESVFTDYQFKGRHYRWRPEADAQRQQALWAKAKATYGLPVLVIEYVDPHNAPMRAAAADQVRAAGFIPYVADIGLTALWQTP